jgi:hypothetical protein
VWERAKVVPPPIITFMGILPSTNYKSQHTHPVPIEAQVLHIPPRTAPTRSRIPRTPSPYLRCPLLRPHARYLEEASVPNRRWFPRAPQDLRPQQRALDTNFVPCASKRSALITHCRAVWTAHPHRHCLRRPKSLRSRVEVRQSGKENCVTRFCSRYGALMVGRSLVRSSPATLMMWLWS